MKKVNATIYQMAATLGLVFMFSLAFNSSSFGQCLNSISYASAAAPTQANPFVTITTCAYSAEYEWITNAQAGSSYKFNDNLSGFLTIRQGTPGGVVLGTGTGSVTVACTATGNIYVHINTDPTCSPTYSGPCRTITAEYVQLALCNPVPSGAITASTGTSDCLANVTVPVPTFDPAGCGANYSLRYQVGSGPFTALNPPYPASIVLTGLSRGVYTITWQTFNPATGIIYGMAEQTITVQDLIPPVINCPSDIVVTLAPGACNQFVNYSVTATDNCPFVSDVLYTQNPPNLDPNAPIASLSSLNCGGSQTKFGRVFGGPSQPAFAMSGLQLGISNYVAPGPYTFNVYQLTSGTTPAPGNTNFQLLGGPFSITPAYVPLGYVPIVFPSPVNVPAGSRFFVEIISELGDYTMGNIAATDLPGMASYIASAACGLPDYQPFADIGFPTNALAFNVVGQAGSSGEPVLISGLPSGSEFGVGTVENCFEITDASGNSASCCFKVTVKEFPNPTNVLACNDLVQISLDEDCSVQVNAAQILEGGPYGCYDNYEVYYHTPQGALITPFIINYSFVGNGPHSVRVVDPKTGQSCWGQITVKDKLPPVMECRDINITCTQDAYDPAILHPAPFVFEATDPIQIPASFVPHGGGTAYTYNGSGGPQGEFFDLTNNSSEPVQIQGFGLRTPVDGPFPEPAIYRVWTRPTFQGFQENAGAWNFKGEYAVAPWPPYFDNGTGDCAQMTLNEPILLGPGETIGFHFFSPNHGLVFNYTFGVQPPVTNGIFTLTGGETAIGEFGPLFNAPANEIPNIQINYAVQLDPVPVTDNCAGELTVQNGGLTYEDSYTPGSCGGPSGTYVRTWTAKDTYGNKVTCNQTITVKRPTLDDVEVPGDIMWTCDQYDAYSNVIGATALHKYIGDSDDATEIIEVNLDPNCDDSDQVFQDNPGINSTNTANGGTGCPGNGLDDADVLELTGSGIPGIKGDALVSACGISYEHADLKIEVCPGTFKIVRKWTLIDWCANPVDVREYTQVIKVGDVVAPEISAPADLTIDVYAASVPANQGSNHVICEGTFVVPPAGASDNCSGVSAYRTELWSINAQGGVQSLLKVLNSNGGVFTGVQMFVNGVQAQYIVRYYATDGCDNQGYDDMKITLRDKVPPVAVCDEHTQVTITNNGIGTGESCSKLFAESLDDGSHDNCGPVWFLLAKMSDSFSPNIFNRCYYPSRDFCCEDVGDNTVILLVLDKDPTPFFSNLNSPSLGCDGTPGLFLTTAFSGANYNACMVEVEVLDKLPPVRLTCPSNIRISCDEYADNLQTALQGKTPAEKCQILTDAGYGEATFYDNCSVEVTCTANENLDMCLDGTITRTWNAVDGAGNAALQNCTQSIFVDHVSDWSVEFPDDKNVTCGTNTPDFGEPKIFNETCELIAISFSDETFAVGGNSNACYKIVRTWTVINWCVVGANVDQEVVELSEAQLWNQGVTTLADRDINGDGYFNASEVRSNKSHRTFRDSWNNVAGRKHKPVRADNVSFGPITDPDTDTDSDPWDGYITYQQVIMVTDNVAPVFVNGCSIEDVCIYANCSATVLLPTPEIEDCSDEIVLTAQIKIGGVWLSGFGPYNNVGPGTYEVRYNVHDRCNNQTDCNTTVTVKDCKKPTPYCKNGLVIEIDPPDPHITIWASDFDAGSFDNCPGPLKISFSADVNDISRTYYCEHVGQQPVQIWVTDASGNQDYCETFIIIQDNLGVCDDPQIQTIAGAMQTEGAQGVEGANVSVNSSNGGYNQTVTTTTGGVYSFVGVPLGGDYTVTPTLDTNPLNGVSTFDLVLISKHILGVQSLDSPYKIIAADANKSDNVTTFDLVEIRKMILFINTEFPNNTSWRFVDKGFVFPNPTNPFQTQFPEVVNVNNLSSSQFNKDFVAVKIGDVNGSAVTSLLGGSEDRGKVGELLFDVEGARLIAGESHVVEFRATDFAVSGYQFTLNYDSKSLEFVGVGEGLADASNFGLSLLEEGVITTSWNSEGVERLAAGEVVFSLEFKARRSVELSEALSISSRYTVSEAYTGQGELMNVGLSFNQSLVESGFELYQNTPNPFNGVTVIGFNLPEATSAKLTISDVQGKVLKVIEGDYAKGYNQESIQRSELGATGVLYYRLDSGSNTATLKMILVD